MSRALRATVAHVALTGLLMTTALSAATAVHVALEHETPLPTAHGHHADPAATDDCDHAHERVSDVTSTEHAHAARDEIERSSAPGHRHPIAVVADVQSRIARLIVYTIAGGAANAPATLRLTAARSLVGPASRAGPVARSAPLARRSVVLQV